MRPSTTSIAAAVGRSLGSIPVDRFMCTGRGRKSTPALAHMIVTYICRHAFGWSYPELARECVYGDSKGPIHAVARIAKMIEQGEPRVLSAVEAGERAAAEYTVDANYNAPVQATGARDVRLRKGDALSIELDLDGMIGAAE